MTFYIIQDDKYKLNRYIEMFVMIKMKMENKNIENDNMVEKMMKEENINDFPKIEKWVT